MHKATAPWPNIQVLIVGAGPAGLTTALELAQLGIRSIVLNRYTNTAHTPRAHVVNQRTMEIFRHLGLEDRVRVAASPHSVMEHNAWVSSLAGREWGRISAWGAGEGDATRYREASPSSMSNLPQHLLEPILVEEAMKTGLVDLRFGHEFVAFEQDGEGVTSTIRTREHGAEYTIRSTYLVGADGARSRVLEQAGLHVEGPPPFGDGLFVWFHADLTPFVAHRPGILYHTVVRDGRAAFIMVEPWDEWIAGFAGGAPLDPDDHEDLRARILRGIGNPMVDVEIKNVSKWALNAQAAPRYSHGRVFCMGDAVHRHTPWNGLGLNTGVADAHNLAWKLAMVLEGSAHESLLETYTEERAPVGRRVVDRATASAFTMMAIPDTLGLEMDLDADTMDARARQLSDGSEQSEAKLAEFRTAIESIKGPGFNALGIEVGHSYPTGALVPETTPAPEQIDPDTDYVPTTRPGARLPHVWLDAGRVRISTLDLLDSRHFTLIVGATAGAWYAAAEEARQICRLNVQVVQVGGRYGILDPAGEWAKHREVADDGAVLVRPDGHVAWRAKDRSGVGEFVEAMQAIVGRSPRSRVTSGLDQRSLVNQG